MEERHVRQRRTEERELPILLAQLCQWRALTHSVLERVVADQLLGQPADGDERTVRMHAPSGPRPRAQILGEHAPLPDRARRLRVVRRPGGHQRRRKLRHAEGHVVGGTVPTDVHQERPRPAEDVEEGLQDPIRPSDDPPDRPDRCVEHHGVAGRDAQLSQVGGDPLPRHQSRGAVLRASSHVEITLRGAPRTAGRTDRTSAPPPAGSSSPGARRGRGDTAGTRSTSPFEGSRDTCRHSVADWTRGSNSRTLWAPLPTRLFPWYHVRPPRLERRHGVT